MVEFRPNPSAGLADYPFFLNRAPSRGAGGAVPELTESMRVTGKQIAVAAIDTHDRLGRCAEGTAAALTVVAGILPEAPPSVCPRRG